jgi:hypothetical protein
MTLRIESKISNGCVQFVGTCRARGAECSYRNCNELVPTATEHQRIVETYWEEGDLAERHPLSIRTHNKSLEHTAITSIIVAKSCVRSTGAIVLIRGGSSALCYTASDFLFGGMNSIVSFN